MTAFVPRCLGRSAASPAALLAVCLAALAASPVSAAEAAATKPVPTAAGKPAPAAAAKPPVDINTANRAQLQALPGIDDAQAQKIIDGRPYRSKAELVTAHVLPVATFVSIKGSIIALPPRRADGKP